MSEAKSDLLSFSYGLLESHPKSIIDAAFRTITKEKDITKANTFRELLPEWKGLHESEKIGYFAELNDLYIDADIPEGLFISKEDRYFLSRRGDVLCRMLNSAHRCFDFALEHEGFSPNMKVEACHPEDTWTVEYCLLQMTSSSS